MRAILAVVLLTACATDDGLPEDEPVPSDEDEEIEPQDDPAAALEVMSAIGAAPVGYGQHTTGGGCFTDACKCIVTTTVDAGPGSLRACVSSDEPKWIVFEGAGRGTIALETSLKIGSNTTIDGRGQGAVTVTTSNDTHIAYIRDSENVIITDMRFKVNLSPICMNPPDADATFACGGGIEIDGATKNVWIHQSDFETCGGKCIAVWTHDAVDLAPNNCNVKAHGGDLITISNNRFRNSFYGVLIGASHQLPNCQIPRMRATVYRNVFDNVDRRSPRASELSHVHVLNNVITNWGDNSCDDNKSEAFGASVMSGAQMLLENNWLQARASAGACKVGSHIDGGFMKAIGNVARSGAIVRSNQPSRVFNPRTAAGSYTYTASAMTAALQQQIVQEAGPR